MHYRWLGLGITFILISLNASIEAQEKSYVELRNIVVQSDPGRLIEFAGSHPDIRTVWNQRFPEELFGGLGGRSAIIQHTFFLSNDNRSGINQSRLFLPDAPSDSQISDSIGMRYHQVLTYQFNSDGNLEAYNIWAPPDTWLQLKKRRNSNKPHPILFELSKPTDPSDLSRQGSEVWRPAPTAINLGALSRSGLLQVVRQISDGTGAAYDHVQTQVQAEYLSTGELSRVHYQLVGLSENGGVGDNLVPTTELEAVHPDHPEKWDSPIWAEAVPFKNCTEIARELGD